MNALRDAMPVNARGRDRLAKRSPAVSADIERVLSIWARGAQRASGPWLFGEFCAADIMFAPIALRFQTYGVELTGPPKLYYHALLSHPLVQEWLILGSNEPEVIEQFELPLRRA